MELIFCLSSVVVVYEIGFMDNDSVVGWYCGCENVGFWGSDERWMVVSSKFFFKWWVGDFEVELRFDVVLLYEFYGGGFILIWRF